MHQAKALMLYSGTWGSKGWCCRLFSAHSVTETHINFFKQNNIALYFYSKQVLQYMVHSNMSMKKLNRYVRTLT